jgi:hypothetical protein
MEHVSMKWNIEALYGSAKDDIAGLYGLLDQAERLENERFDKAGRDGPFFTRKDGTAELMHAPAIRKRLQKIEQLVCSARECDDLATVRAMLTLATETALILIRRHGMLLLDEHWIAIQARERIVEGGKAARAEIGKTKMPRNIEWAKEFLERHTGKQRRLSKTELMKRMAKEKEMGATAFIAAVKKGLAELELGKKSVR